MHREVERQRAPVTMPVLEPDDAHRYHTLSIHQVARSGPIEAFAPVIAMNPQALTKQDHLRSGGHMPIASAVLSGEVKHVRIIIEALRSHGYLSQKLLDTPGRDGYCALSLAIKHNGQRQTFELLEAGASPLLPIPQEVEGHSWRRLLRPFGSGPMAANAAEFAVDQSRPYILSVLLKWDERDAARRQSLLYSFDVEQLVKRAQALGSAINTPALREALESSASRRRHARQNQP